MARALPLPEGRLPAMVQVLAPVAATPAFLPLGVLTLGQIATREVELHAALEARVRALPHAALEPQHASRARL